jgi:cobalt-zinc-cadmium resistance protein CzcA
MGAVDFGVIVDGGVVIIESILVALASDRPEDAALSVDERIESATKSVVRPTVFALLIIIAAYLPIFMLQRVEGRIFSPMANTVVAALMGALLFSVILIPVLASLVYRRRPRHRESPVLRLASRAYEPTLVWALHHPWLTLAGAGALLAMAGALVPRLGSEFLPELNEGALYVDFTLPSNVSLSEGRKLVPQLTNIFLAQPEAEEIMSQLGRPEDGTDPKLTNNLEFFLKLKPPAEWPPQRTSIGDVIDSMSHAVEQVPGVEVNFSQPIRDNVNENISGQVGQVAAKLYGDDLDVLQKQAERVKDVLAGVPGVADLAIVKSGEAPQIQVNPDRLALARYGMALGDFQHAFQTAVGGSPVADFWEGERRFDVVTRFPLGAREDVDELRQLRIPVTGGAAVPLDALAHVDLGYGRASISRENGRRYIGIRMNVRGRDLGGFVEEARARVSAQAPNPAGVTVEWGGEFENKERAMARLELVVPVALVITLLLLFKAFDSFSLAVLTLLNVPFALLGGVVGLYLAGMPMSVAAAVGFIALIGQASLNGVLVLSAVAEHRRRGEGLRASITNGCRQRLRPVLMTASLAALGLVPAALSRGIGSETQRPLAVVIVFGTLSACALTLVLLPVMYQLFVRATESVRPRLRAHRVRLASALGR